VSIPIRPLLAATIIALLTFSSPAAAEPADEVNRQIREQSSQLEVIVEHYNELREDLRITTAQTAVLAKQINPLKIQMGERRAAVGRLAAASFRSHRISPVNVLLDSSSTRSVLDRMLLLETYAQRKRLEINELADLRDRYETASRTLDALVTQQRQQQEEQARQRTKIEQSIADLQKLRQRAGNGLARVSNVRFTPPTLTGPVSEVLNFALRQIGKGYQWAADGPDRFDCSGLVAASFRTIGVDLPHNSRKQRQAVRSVSRSELTPGDLVFFYSDLHHVGIYVGDGKMVHAPQYGEQIRVDPIDNIPIHSYGRAT
jgi:cell wall-associated NlpC family hydrolase